MRRKKTDEACRGRRSEGRERMCDELIDQVFVLLRSSFNSVSPFVVVISSRSLFLLSLLLRLTTFFACMQPSNHHVVFFPSSTGLSPRFLLIETHDRLVSPVFVCSIPCAKERLNEIEPMGCIVCPPPCIKIDLP